MKTQNINELLQKIENRVVAHRISIGNYSRYLWQNEKGTQQMGSNPYGCADAANLLYTLGRFPSDADERAAFVNTLQGFQDKGTGLFFEPTHHTVHTTAHCVAALELFGAKPLYPLHELEQYREIDRFFAWMEREDWLHRGCMAHVGAGLFAAMVITESVDDVWCQRYFAWFDEHCDAESGLWKQEPTESFPIHLQMGDTFHYLFNYEYMHHAFPYPERLIDSCLAMYDEGRMPETFGKQFHFIEMDWVYCLNRASRQTTHRFAEIKKTLSAFADQYLEYLRSVDFERSSGANDLHLLFGVTCCLAELQAALPDCLPSTKPLRLVLDRRPFI